MMTPNEDLATFAAQIAWLRKESNRILKLSKKSRSKASMENLLHDITEINTRLLSLKREFEKKYQLGKGDKGV